MFKVSIFTRLLRQECSWDEARVGKLTRHLYRLGYNVRHSERDACELIAEKEFGNYRDPWFWLREMPESLEGFEPSRIIRRVEVSTNIQVVSGGISHGISKPSGRDYYKFSIGSHGLENGSVTSLKIKDAEDFNDGIRLFGNQVAMFTLMAVIFRDADKTQKLISENHELGGALRNLEGIKCTAMGWAPTLLM